MHAVMRYYSGAGATELFDELGKHKGDIEALIRGVNGFVSYALVQIEGVGGVSVTVCQDKAGTDESVRVAADWIRQNVPSITTAPPMVSEGEVVVAFSK